MAQEAENPAAAGPPAAPPLGPPPGPPLSMPLSIQGAHLLRTVQVNTLALSQMADQKASILMGAAFVVFSIAVSRGLDGALPLSLLVLGGFAFLSTLFAVMAVLPRSGNGAVPPPGARNLLFFGHYARMDEAEWSDEIIERLRSDEAVYRTMMRDIYQSGQVLELRKYPWLRRAYRTFAVGLVATLAAFIAELCGIY